MKGMTKILGGKLRRNKPCLTLDERSSHNKSKHCRAEKSQRPCYGYVRFFFWVSLLLYLCSAGPDLFWLVAWKPEKHEAVGDVIQKPMVRTGGLVTNVVAEENYTQGRLRKNVFSDPSREFSGFLDVKVFVYELPLEFNEDWLVNSRCSSHLFAAEVAIHRALLNSPVRVFDPQEADFFFVPVYVSCNFSTKNGFPALGHARSLLGSAVRYISETMPFWNRSRGSDHVFAATHDYGACFHAMEDVAISDGIPEFLQNSIILQTFGVKGKHRCQDVEHIQIPPYVAPKPMEALWAAAPPKAKRDIWVFFRGKMEVHPKNISGRVYSKGVRTVIWQKFGHNRRFYIKRTRFEGYRTEILRSVFCLCPLGWAPWSPRIVESVALGCVPVIIADNVALPYPDVVPWANISLSVPERDVAKLGKVLERVTATNLTAIQNNLWNETIRRALLFNEPLQRGDATWQVLQGLTRKLGRSYRNRSGSVLVE